MLLQAMLAGQAQAAQNGVAETATAILRGGDVRMLGVTAKIFPYSLIAAKNIKSAKDLVGGRLAINRVGDVSAYGSQIALRKLGLNPDKDVTMLQVGGSPQRLAALAVRQRAGGGDGFHVGAAAGQARVPRAGAAES